MHNYNALVALYEFHDRFVQDFPRACREGCSTCCTVNVTATSLETSWLAANSDIDMEKIKIAARKPRYQPAITANRLALACLNQQELPEETSGHAPGACPLLDETGRCSVYEYRPFSCRAMLSASTCREAGEADMPPFIFTVNLAFYQILEHLDRHGFSGNMIDLLDESGERDAHSRQLKTNSPVPDFMVPPDEQLRFRSLLRRIFNTELSDGSRLADLLPEELLQT